MWALLVAAAAVLVVVVVMRARARRARLRALAQPLPGTALALLERRVPLYRALPAVHLPALQRAVREFLYDKQFVGCGGLEITDEMRYVIAAQACVLVCARPDARYTGFTSVLVYPDAFVVDHVEHDGAIEIVREEARAGESWVGGPVILSWRDVQRGLAVADDGYNVVLHEFAHKLDDENQLGAGLPLLRDPAQLESWARVLSQEFAALRRGEGRLINKYGAVSPAEFFAVVTEAFFEQSRDLAREHPALYAEFRRYYGLDPAVWARN